MPLETDSEFKSWPDAVCRSTSGIHR